MICHFAGSMFNGSVRIFTPLGGIGVSMFLLLSAYGLNESYNKSGLNKWWRKRFIAVFIPYIVIETIFYWPFHEWNVRKYLLDITLINPLYCNGWYLNYLLLCYILFYAVMLIPKMKEYKKTVFWVLAVVMFVWFSTCSPIRAEQSLSFLVGMILSEFKDRDEIKKLASWKSGMILIILAVIFLSLKQTPVIRNSSAIVYCFIELLIKLPCGLGIILTVLSVPKWVNLKIFAIIGAISYELYLVHGYILEFVPHSARGMIFFAVGSFGTALILHLLVSTVQKYCKRIMQLG